MQVKQATEALQKLGRLFEQGALISSGPNGFGTQFKPKSTLRVPGKHSTTNSQPYPGFRKRV
ncbi:hypothetical protein QJS04_geneDACA022610 [Acorus gramineus]|uniref:Uncharacterized protein n=1 Tax=Acorus gramineus TaxID=55184 RepID=A0AAV9BVY4_ACOGR|nr:hypothetical protein QJS04_geneDACA022610 [Acorus gramineus]